MASLKETWKFSNKRSARALSAFTQLKSFLKLAKVEKHRQMIHTNGKYVKALKDSSGPACFRLFGLLNNIT